MNIDQIALDAMHDIKAMDSKEFKHQAQRGANIQIVVREAIERALAGNRVDQAAFSADLECDKELTERLRQAEWAIEEGGASLKSALEREQALAKERDALRIAEDHQISMRLRDENHIARLRSALAYVSDYLNSNKLNTIGYASKAHCEMRFALASYSMIGSHLHHDDMAIDKFSLAMKEKMAASREKGRGGWEDPDVCTAVQLAEMLISHLEKGNGGTFQDIANFAMMLHQRDDDPFVLATTLTKRDLIKQAEALEKLVSCGRPLDNDSILDMARGLRQQAAAL